MVDGGYNLHNSSFLLIFREKFNFGLRNLESFFHLVEFVDSSDNAEAVLESYLQRQ